ncbi:hypothetical protein GBZ48_07180 [Azospirillum melinis]|uniref:Uncharacterized protein n=1 Tax=Azospirillum melinis TaxID=328839 RepID=A0ABX2KCR8_9PROT|nr:hypothetical protein [Azospirillum melinis]MBP2310604.1 hypothetical protein [Azospirillum melinis]NUA99068.1 hypothetical protein [Azospirillum melinis]
MAARSTPLTAWAGWLAGPLGWLIQHQGGSNTVFWNCALGRPSLVVTLGVVGALVALAGGWLSWRAMRNAGPADAAAPGRGSQRFIAMLGVLAVLIFLVAIAGQTMAGIMLRGCGR